MPQLKRKEKSIHKSSYIWNVEDNLLEGGRVNDFMQDYPGNDNMYRGSGNDILYGDAQDGDPQGGNGADIITGDSGDDMLFHNQ